MWFRSRKPDSDTEPPDHEPAGGFWLDEVREALRGTREIALQSGASQVSPEILLLGLLSRDRFEACRVLTGLGIQPSDLQRELKRGLRPAAPPRGKNRQRTEFPYTFRAKRVLGNAMSAARALKQSVSTAHLLLAVSDETSEAGKLLRGRGAGPEQIRARLKRDSVPEAQLAITIDDNSDRQIYDQIVSQIREAIATSSLRPGDRLPAIRRLADQLGIAPGTVARAYAELETAQVIMTDGPRGTFVAEPPLPTPPSARPIAMRDLFRPVVVAGFHLGAQANELRAALEEAMRDIYPADGEELETLRP